MTTATLTNEQRIRERIDSGDYADAAEVVTKALDALEYQENLRLVRRLIGEAWESVEKHGTIPLTPTLFQEIYEEALEANRRGDPISDHVRG